MKYADQINGLNTDAAAAKYELFWTIVNEVYYLVDTVMGLLQGML
jgi:hypothetical protein